MHLQPDNSLARTARDMIPSPIRAWYLITAAVIAFMTSTYTLWSFLNGLMPGELVFQLNGILTAVLVVTWLATDPRIPVAQRPSFDHVMLLWATFPLLAVYQMFSAHRWRGVLIVFGLLVLLAAPSITLAVAYMATE